MRHPTPLWVKIFAGLGLTLLAVIAVLHVTGNSLHGGH